MTLSFRQQSYRWQTDGRTQKLNNGHVIGFCNFHAIECSPNSWTLNRCACIVFHEKLDCFVVGAHGNRRLFTVRCGVIVNFIVLVYEFLTININCNQLIGITFGRRFSMIRSTSSKFLRYDSVRRGKKNLLIPIQCFVEWMIASKYHVIRIESNLFHSSWDWLLKLPKIRANMAEGKKIKKPLCMATIAIVQHNRKCVVTVIISLVLF